MAVQSVERAFHLLEAIAERPDGLVSLAKRAGLPLTTTSRLLATLEDRAAVRRDSDGTYCIGSLVERLGERAYRMPSLRDACRPELVRLTQLLDEAACLSVPLVTETLTLVQYDVERPVQAQNWEGHRWAITGPGSGVVMMAKWPEARVRPLLENLSPARRRSMSSLIESARQSGVSWSEGSKVEGLSSVAAPVLGSDGTAVAAVLAYGPSYRFPGEQKRDAIEAAVMEAAHAVTEAIGGVER